MTRARLTRVILAGLAWWLAGCTLVTLAAWARDAVPDEPIPFSLKIDLSKDIGWVKRHLPDEALAAVRFDTPDVGWRINGRQLLTARFGEEVATFEVWRTLGNGTIERDRADTAIVVERVRRGWPFLCLEGASWTPGLQQPIPDRLLRLHTARGKTINVPYGILIGPFLVDGAAWGLALFALSFLPKLAERIARRRRGLCAQCAHSLGGANRCPECGASAR
jgi:hypothetical protein